MPITDELLFHKLVHVEQHRQLSVVNFSAPYVRGFLVGGGHEGIPLNEMLMLLESALKKDPTMRFSVADEVAEWIAADGF